MPDNNNKLKGGIVIHSRPYSKKSVEGPYQIIKIHYPQNEIFSDNTNKSHKDSISNVYVKVRFQNNRTYTYYSSDAINVGNKVKVEGKMADEIGEVIEIVKDEPNGRAASYVLNVKKIVE